MNDPRSRPTDTRSWLPAAAAGLVLALVVGVGVFAGGNDSGDSTSGVGSVPDTTSSAANQPAAIIAPVTTDDTPPAPAIAPLESPLSLGSVGDDVRRLQERLTELGFQPGPADGQFGSGTQQAVWAFKKLIGNIAWEEFAQRSDQTVVADELWQQMFDPTVRFLPRRPGQGTHVEVYLPIQVMAVFRNDEPIFISHISSGELRPDGEPATFCETATYDTDEYGNPYPEPVTKQVCAEAKSPGGVFNFNRSYDGQRISPLGGMKNPWYFNYGIAIHGAATCRTARPRTAASGSRTRSPTCSPTWSSGAIGCTCGVTTAKSQSSTASASHCRRSTGPTRTPPRPPPRRRPPPRSPQPPLRRR